MKRWLPLAVAVSLSAEPIHWRGDYDGALQEARTQGRALVVLLVRRHCLSCGKVAMRLGRDAALVRLLNEKSVPVIVTKENEDYPVEMLYTDTYPTLFLLTPSETFLTEPMRGEVNASLLRVRLEKEAFDE